ncbi:MAG: PaaI family thioesterase [Spirochaetia bacterium]|nr:PaaI family thioesterase [Spirochaetia bacterium]
MNFNFESLPIVPNDPHSTCFACGKGNPKGFQLVFHSDGKILYSKFTTRDEFSGWSNLIHGGILATLMDENMAWTAISLKKKYILTKSMNVFFKKPVLAGSTIYLKGYIEKEVSHREIITISEIYNESNELCASSQANIILFSKESFHKLNVSGSEFLDNFEKEVFNKL